MTIPASFLDELRARTPINSLIGARVRLARSGRNWKGCCPFHGEKTPSFYVYADHFHCFGCGAHGDAVGFVMQSQGLGFPEAVEALASQAGMQVPKATPEAAAAERQRLDLNAVLEAAAVAFQRRLRLPEGRDALGYLIGRGLSEDTIQRFGLGWSGAGRGAIAADLYRDGVTQDQLIEAGLIRRDDETGRVTDLFFNRVMFPIRDRRGRVVSFGGRVLGDGLPKYVNGPETVLFSKRRTLYGLDLAREGLRGGGDLLVVEGYMDVIALHQAGFPGAVAPLGTALTEEQMAELWRISPAPVLCFDGDRAGTRAAARTADLALPLVGVERTLRFATLPPGDDPDALVRKDGAPAFQAVLDAARPFSVAQFAFLRGNGMDGTAEQRAAFRARLLEAAGRVQDKPLAAEYRRTWLAWCLSDQHADRSDPAGTEQPAAVFADCAARWPAATARARDLVPWGGDDQVDLSTLIAAAPVRERAGRFEVIDDVPPHRGDWRVLLAVRAEAPNPDYSDAGVAETLRRGTVEGEIIDLVACSPDLMRVTSRLVGAASVLGWPQVPELIADRARVFETPCAWLKAGGDGAVLLGPDGEWQNWLMRCEAGVVATRLPFAAALEKKLRRAGIRKPLVFVTEAA
jgi:DNA primase catalytic core